MAQPPLYFRVSPKFWADSETWTDDARLLALYVLTCEHRSTEGLFRLPTRYMAADLGWSKERLEQPFHDLLTEGFIEYDQERSLMLIVNAMKYQSPQNPNQVKHALRKLESVPLDSPLTSTFKRLAERFCERLAEGLPEGFGESPSPSPSPSPTQPRPLLSSDESNNRDDVPIEVIHTPAAIAATRAALQHPKAV